jgi:hypothetical protein
MDSNTENLQVGQRISDNDPRMVGRVLTISAILPNGVEAKNSIGRTFRILRRRIYTDGKLRRNGFSLVPNY